jgi:hypothetical protein
VLKKRRKKKRVNIMQKKVLAIVLTAFFLLAIGSPAMAARDHQGKPSKHEMANSMGYYIWQEGTRWHLRTVNAGTQRLFTGMVETDGAFADVSTVQSEKVERVAVSVSNQKIDFHLNSAAKTDGFSFTANSGQNLTFTLYVDGRPVDSADVNLGRNNRNPNGSSFTVRLNDDGNYPPNQPTPYTGQLTSYDAQGQPSAMVAGNALGYFIWRDGERWYLKTTTRGAERQFSGTVRTNGRFTDLGRDNLEDNDVTRVNSNSAELSFDLRTAGGLDGFSFRTSSDSEVTFDLYLDGQAISTSNISIGRQNMRPGANPFSINRTGDQFNQTNQNDSQFTSYDVQGQPPALMAGSAFGYFIWQDQNRWYLQTTTTGAEKRFRGVIETEGRISDVQTLRSVRADGAVVEAAENRIGFNFKTGGEAGGISLSFPEGLKFNQADKLSGLSFLVTDGATLRFTLYADDEAINSSNIYLGSANKHPSANVLRIDSRNK